MSALTAKNAFITRHKALLSLFALTLVLKVIMLWDTDVVSNDGPTYLNVSKQFLDNKLNFLDAFRGSWYFYPALVAVLSKLMPGNQVESLIAGGQLLSLLFSVFSIIPFYLLVEKIWSSRAAFWGGLIFCVAPGINRYAVDVMRDPGYLFCFLWALYLAYLFIEQHRSVWLLGAAVFSALAFMFRVEAFLLPFLLLPWMLFSFMRGGRGGNWLVRTGLLLVVIISVAGAFYLYFRSEMGASSRFGEITDGISRLTKGEIFGYLPELKTALDAAGSGLPGTPVGNDFFAIAKNNIRLIYFLGLVTLVAKVAFLPFFLLAIGGVVWAVRNRVGSWYLLTIVAAYLALGFFYNMQRNYLEERYVYSVVVPLYAYAGYALALLLDRDKGMLPAGLIYVTILLLVLVPATVKNLAIQEKRQTYPFKEAGLWLTAQPDITGARLMANERKVPFYAGKFANYTPCDAYRLRELGAALNDFDYIAIEEGEKYKPHIVELENFTIAKQVESDRYLAVIYKKTAGAAQ